MAIWIPDADIAISSVIRSNSGLAFWQHVSEDPESIDGNYLETEGTLTLGLWLGLNGAGPVTSAILAGNVTCTGETLFLGAQLAEYYGGFSGDVIFAAYSGLANPSGYFELPLTPQTGTPHEFAVPSLNFSFRAFGEGSVRIDALRVIVNASGDSGPGPGGQSGVQSSILLPAFVGFP